MDKGLNSVSTGGMRGGWSATTSCGNVLCRTGKPVMPIELQVIVGDANEGPFCGDFIDASEGEAVEASKLLDLSKHGLHDVLSLCVGASPFDGA